MWPMSIPVFALNKGSSLYQTVDLRPISAARPRIDLYTKNWMGGSPTWVLTHIEQYTKWQCQGHNFFGQIWDISWSVFHSTSFIISSPYQEVDPSFWIYFYLTPFSWKQMNLKLLWTQLQGWELASLNGNCHSTLKYRPDITKYTYPITWFYQTPWKLLPYSPMQDWQRQTMEFRRDESDPSLFLTPVSILWDGSHFKGHVRGELWYLRIWCGHTVHIISVACLTMQQSYTPLRKATRAKQNRFSYMNKSWGKITHLHTWRQHGRHIRFPLKIFMSPYTYPSSTYVASLCGNCHSTLQCSTDIPLLLFDKRKQNDNFFFNSVYTILV